MSQETDERLTKKTLELPAVSNRQKELRDLERENRLFIEKNRRELRMITQGLTNLADRLPDTKTQLSVYKGLLPTARAIDSNVIPDSVAGELNNLNLLADTISAHLKGREVEAEITRVKTLLHSILSTIPQ